MAHHLDYRVIAVGLVSLVVPVASLIIACVFRLFGFQRASRACISAGLCSYIGGATTSFTTIGAMFFTNAFGFWQFPSNDDCPSRALYVALLLAGIIIPLVGFVVGGAYGLYRVLRRPNQV